MTEHNSRPDLRVTGKSPLEALHDLVISDLESPEKAGIYTLLKKNNRLFKREICNFLAAKHQTIDPSFFAALDNLLDIHAKECYTIGYLDSAGNHRNECRANKLI